MLSPGGRVTFPDDPNSGYPLVAPVWIDMLPEFAAVAERYSVLRESPLIDCVPTTSGTLVRSIVADPLESVLSNPVTALTAGVDDPLRLLRVR